MRIAAWSIVAWLCAPASGAFAESSEFAFDTRLTPAYARAQSSTEPPLPPAQPDPLARESGPKEPWTFGLSVYGYSVPDDSDYLQPTFTADRGLLHIEARYNYEDLDTASAWMGINFGGNLELLEWELTPMAGVVVGETRGFAPGYRGSLELGWFDLFSEGEYLFDTEDSHDSFFYSWNELGVSPIEMVRFGVVSQHTRVYETERDIQRGFLLGVYFERISANVYAMNPDDKTTWIFSVGVGM